MFIPERAETRGSTEQVCKSFFPPRRPQGRDTSLGSCAQTAFSATYPFPFHLLPSPFTAGHPQDRGDDFTLSGTCYCHTGTTKRHSHWHIFLIHIQAVSIIHSSLLPPSHPSPALAALPLLITGSLLLKAAWGGLSGNTK